MLFGPFTPDIGSALLSRGAVAGLENIEVVETDLMDGGALQALCQALADPACVCAKRLKVLRTENTSIDSDGVRIFADLFRKGSFPALQKLDIVISHHVWEIDAVTQLMDSFRRPVGHHLHIFFLGL